MRMVASWVLIASMLCPVLQGCNSVALGPVPSLVTIDQRGPVGVGDVTAGVGKRGRAKAHGILIVSWGDASITAAMKEGDITRIHHVDNQVLNVLGIYASYETHVVGE